MIAFSISVLLMLGAALFVVVRAMLRPPADAAASEARLDAYRNRIAELETEVGAGTVADSEAAAVRIELERELLKAVQDAPETMAAGRGARWAAATLILLLPAAALGLYLYLGTPMLIEGPEPQQPASTADVERMVEGLAQRLEKQPGDETGWMMLGRSYMVLGRYADAAAALERLHRLTGDRPDILIRLADALAMSNGGRLTGRPVELVQRVLAIDAQNHSALWLAGIAAMESGDPASALRHWETLAPLLKPDDAGRAQLDRLIAHARKEQSRDSATAEAEAPDPAAPRAGSQSR